MSPLARGALGRLRVRLVLAFTLVALLPVITLPFVLASITARFDARFAGELDQASGVVREELDTLAHDVETRTGAAASALVPRLVDVEGAEPPDLLALSEESLATYGLDALLVVAPDGRIRLCGHLPARLADLADPALLKLPPGGPTLVPLEIARGDDIVTTPVLAWVVRDGAWTVLGGASVDDSRWRRFERLVRGSVERLDRAPAKLSGNERLVSVVKGLSAPVLRLSFTDPALDEAKKQVVRGALGAFGFALVAGLALSWWLARRLARPVASLLEGTRYVAEGRLGYQVKESASGELGQLVDGFNGMSAALARTQERLAQAERVAAWEQIARSLAHEIKNPLTPISLTMETLQRAWDRQHPEFDRYFREGSSTVLEEVGRLKRLATEFAEFARWPRPMKAPAPPSELVAGVAALWSSPPEGITLDTSVAEGLPPVDVDRDQLQRALGNLVKNAVEAMPKGGKVTIRAASATRDDQPTVRFEVQDSGGGIAPEVREKLFEPYVTSKATGTGLGLAIVQRIVTEHAGWLSAHDAEGGGTVFLVELPVAPRA